MNILKKKKRKRGFFYADLNLNVYVACRLFPAMSVIDAAGM